MGEIYTFNNTSTGKSGTIQTWVVPKNGKYFISAFGAQGGCAYLQNTSNWNQGGRGAKMSGLFVLTKGQTIKILVGQQGVNNPRNSRGAGGGGGTFIYNQTTSTLLIAAGGGGGAGQINDSLSLRDANITVNGNAGTIAPGAGGTNGFGGGNSNYGGGGAGWNSDGSSSSYGKGGIRFLSGGTGGALYSDGTDGGFGGGGGTYAAAGGGGGYSGGGAGGWSYSGNGGGGGSYNIGLEQVNIAGFRENHGLVTMEYLSSINFYCRIDGQIKETQSAFIKLDGIWRPINSTFNKIDGTWRQ